MPHQPPVVIQFVIGAAQFAGTLAEHAHDILHLLALALIDIWHVVIDAGPRVAAAIVVATLLALLVGHVLGGPDPATRTATAISSAVRNPGLALLVATVNAASSEIIATVLAYFVIGALTVIPYGVWRRRVDAHAAGGR